MFRYRNLGDWPECAFFDSGVAVPIQTVVVAIALVLGAIAVWRLARAWWKYRGRRVITCPENQRPAGV